MENTKQQMTQNEFNNFVEELNGKTTEELLALEQEIIAEANGFEKELMQKEFELPTKGWKEASAAVRLLLNKQEVEWRFCLGLKNLYDFFNGAKKPKTINYPTLDNTLRTLGSMQFKGYDEWNAVVEISDYFESNREEYAALTDNIYNIAERHNKIMMALDKRNGDKAVSEPLPEPLPEALPE